MVDEKDIEGDTAEIRVNGISQGKATFELALRSITTGIAIAAAIGIFVEWRDWRDFRAGGGNRCTVHVCDEMRLQILALQFAERELAFRMSVNEREIAAKPPPDLLDDVLDLKSKVDKLIEAQAAHRAKH